MIKLFTKKTTITINKEKIWSFSGGIHPPDMKKQSKQVPLSRLPFPDELIIPVQTHVGTPSDLIVRVGDYVLRGQVLVNGNKDRISVHASTSGTIKSIGLHPTGMPPFNSKKICVCLQPDGKDQWCQKKPLLNYTKYSPKLLLSHIEQAGIVGLGGAGFPTATKLKDGYQLINTLIINAAESEPYITSDEQLIREHADEIVEGILILIHILKPKEVLIGIEDNKPEAITSLKKALINKKDIIKLRIIPTKYPSGGSKQLTKILTGKEIPHQAHSSCIGVLIQNVATVFAIQRAILSGEPLIERVITFTGGAIKNPGNYWVRFGIPVNFLLQQVGIVSRLKQVIIIGGPLMGSILPDLKVPIDKVNNCILAPNLEELGTSVLEENCIRCGFCSQVCPMKLLPQQLYWFSRSKEHEKAQKYHLFDCIECGACSYVCPSNIPLVQYYQKEKEEVTALLKEKKRAFNAKKRFEAKKARLEREKLLLQKRYSKDDLNNHEKGKSSVDIIITKVNMRKKQVNETNPELLNKYFVATQNLNADQLDASKEIKTAKSQFFLNKKTKLSKKEMDVRKTAVAAAIARVKEKRDAKKNNNTQ